MDRRSLNASVPRLQSAGGVVAFLRHRGHPIPSPACFGQITAAFTAGLRAGAASRGIPASEFQTGDRQDDGVQRDRARFGTREGIVCVGIAQAKAKAWTATKPGQGRHVHVADRWTTVCGNHASLSVIDRAWGPTFVKVCGSAPDPMKRCLTGHEGVKRQLPPRRVACTPLANGFQAWARPAVLQAVCESLTAADIEAVLARGRARRPATPFHATDDFGGTRGLRPFASLRPRGPRLTTRRLQAERVAPDCGLGEPQLAALVLPSRAPDGQPAPGLTVGPPRVMALLAARCLVGLTPAGLTTGGLRPQGAQLRGVPDTDSTARQMGSDLRRLARTSLIARVDGKLCYPLTPQGRRVALFSTKLSARVLRPGFQALDHRLTSQAPPPLRTALAAVDAATERLLQEARLAA